MGPGAAALLCLQSDKDLRGCVGGRIGCPEAASTRGRWGWGCPASLCSCIAQRAASPFLMVRGWRPEQGQEDGSRESSRDRLTWAGGGLPASHVLPIPYGGGWECLPAVGWGQHRVLLEGRGLNPRTQVGILPLLVAYISKPQFPLGLECNDSLQDGGQRWHVSLARTRLHTEEGAP